MASAANTQENWDSPIAPRNDQTEMAEQWNGPAPTRYVVREIEFKVVDRRLLFSYRNDSKAQDLPKGGIATVAKALCRPAAAVAVRAAPVPSLAAAPQTPLDLELQGDPIFIILKLAEPVNMTFSANRKAVTHKNDGDRSHYGRLRHVNRKGQESAAPLAGCRLVYFVAAPPAGNYQHGFNFNVDLEQDPGVDGTRRMLPLSIDPDIRFPGGSGV